MTEFVEVCRLADIPEDGALAVRVGEVPIALVRCGAEVFAVSDICSHANVSLSEGEVDARSCTIECWLHGSAFDLRTGEALTPPAVLPISTYPVQVGGSAPDAPVLIATRPERQP